MKSHKVVNILIVAVSAIALIAGALLFANNMSSQNKVNDEVAVEEVVEPVEEATVENCVSEDCLDVEDLEYPAGQLPPTVLESLNKAIDDEYKAHATYEAVINKLGSIRPFSMIIRAEEQHISSLKALYDKYGIPVPADPYTNVEVAATKAENCAVGVQAEIDNAALYREELLPAVADYPDITSVFTRLMNASQDNHLPAFSKCAN